MSLNSASCEGHGQAPMTFLLSPRKRAAEVRSGRIVKWSPMERRRAILKTLTRKRTRGKKKWRGKQTLISASNLCSALGRACKLELNQNTNSAFLEGEEGGPLPGTSILSYPVLSISPAWAEDVF